MNLKKLMDSKRIKDAEYSDGAGNSDFKFTIDGVAVRVISNPHGTTIHRDLDKVGYQSITAIQQSDGKFAISYNDYRGETANVKELGEFNLADTLAFMADYK